MFKKYTYILIMLFLVSCNNHYISTHSYSLLTKNNNLIENPTVYSHSSHNLCFQKFYYTPDEVKKMYTYNLNTKKFYHPKKRIIKNVDGKQIPFDEFKEKEEQSPPDVFVIKDNTYIEGQAFCSTTLLGIPIFFPFTIFSDNKTYTNNQIIQYVQKQLKNNGIQYSRIVDIKIKTEYKDILIWLGSTCKTFTAVVVKDEDTFQELQKTGPSEIHKVLSENKLDKSRKKFGKQIRQCN
jgi:arsenate reductase-like glutaredoxin family protein